MATEKYRKLSWYGVALIPATGSDSKRCVSWQDKVERQGKQLVQEVETQTETRIPWSYFRGKNLTLGYTLPASMTSKVGMDRVRLYLQAQNLFTITKYTGLDPDVTIVNLQEGYNSRRDLEMGVDNGRYPIARTVYFGINVEF